MKRRRLLLIAGALVFACIVVAVLGSLPRSNTEDEDETASQATVPTATQRQAASEPTAMPERTFYFCGIDRCRDSGEYGRLIFQQNINVWSAPDPNRGAVKRTAKHQEKIIVIQERRVNEGPGGLWYELKGGGWTNDLWLTQESCDADNLEQYSFTDCMMGQY